MTKQNIITYVDEHVGTDIICDNSNAKKGKVYL